MIKPMLKKIILEGAAGGTPPPSFDFVLDDYPGAVGAWAVRRLSSSYGGPCLRVRRSSDNAEQDIGFSDNELNVASMEAFCGSSDGFVVTWYDQSGGGYDVTQTTANNQPQIVSSGSTLLENGLPTMQFDATTKFLINDSFASIFSGDNVPMSSFKIATQPNNVTSNQAYLGFGRSTSGTPFMWIGKTQIGNVSRAGVRGDGGALQFVNGTTNLNKQFVISYFDDGDDRSTYLDSTLEASGTLNIGNRTLNRFSIGVLRRNTAGLYWGGNTQEIIFYNGIELANRVGIETNLNNYYNVF